MPVYHKFKSQDILWAVVHASPKIILASGSSGWRGNIGPSSSLSLYEGVRGNPIYSPGNFANSGLTIFPLDPVDTHSIDKTIFVSGSYPSTGSVQMVKVRNTPVAAPFQYQNLVTANDWYQEHFAPINLLYEYYKQFNSHYFTGSYDFYSLFFQQPQSYIAPYTYFSGSKLDTVSSSFTLEIQAKPVSVTNSRKDFVLQSQRGRWKFYITGSTGQLTFTDYQTTLTSSAPVIPGVWQYLAFVADGTSGTFYVNTGVVGRSPYTGTLATTTLTGTVALSSSGYLVVGAELVTSASISFFITGSITASLTSSFVKADQGFYGFLYDSRVWSKRRTFTEISGNFQSTIINSGSDPRLVHYARFNDGPLGHAHGFVSGSGAFDYSASPIHGRMTDFNSLISTFPTQPTWHPVDDPDFVTPKKRVNEDTNFFRVVHIPSMFYGRQIATGSVKLVCNTYANKGLQRVLVDDGKGRLYISGSVLRSIGGEDYRGMRWNKVGNVFYSEGLIVITDPSLYDFGDIGNDASASVDTLQVNFSGLERINTKVFQCFVPAADANGSNNPTFSQYDNNVNDPYYEKWVVKQDTPVTWITAVGVYNEDHKLVAVAKLASPIRKREKDKLLIRLKMDF